MRINYRNHIFGLQMISISHCVPNTRMTYIFAFPTVIVPSANPISALDGTSTFVSVVDACAYYNASADFGKDQAYEALRDWNIRDLLSKRIVNDLGALQKLVSEERNDHVWYTRGDLIAEHATRADAVVVGHLSIISLIAVRNLYMETDDAFNAPGTRRRANIATIQEKWES